MTRKVKPQRKVNPRRKVRTLVRDGDDMREFEYFDDAAKFLGIVTSDSVASLLSETTDQSSTIVVVLTDGEEPPDKLTAQFAAYPPEHRGAFLASGIALVYTLPSRDPVLVVNAGDAFLTIATNAARLASFLLKRYGQRVAIEIPPENISERWVASISAAGDLYAVKMGVGIQPGTPRA